MDYDRECKEKVVEYVNQLPEHKGFNFELLMSKKDLKEVLKTPEHISLANNVIVAVLRGLNQYRRKHPVLDCCHVISKKFLKNVITYGNSLRKM